MQRTYQDMFPTQDFSHLARTVEQYFSRDTPLWWVEEDTGTRGHGEEDTGTRGQGDAGNLNENFSASPLRVRQLSAEGNPPTTLDSPRLPLSASSPSSPIACLWAGNAIDQVQGDRHAHIFLLYVVPEHRRRGIGTALMKYLETWAMQRGDRQIGLQVFQSNTPALNLYSQLGYQTQSLWMIKPLHS
jgi:ribosomal protein S18 acetylase RimI-like enzyme